jgi:hypothetical protein
MCTLIVSWQRFRVLVERVSLASVEPLLVLTFPEVFAIRATNDAEEQRRLCQSVILNISSLKKSIQIAKEKCVQDDISQARLQATLHSTFVYEAEVLATLKEWDTVLSVIKACLHRDFHGFAS